MLDPSISHVLVRAIQYGLCGMVVALAMRAIHRDQKEPSLGQSAAVGFLIGASWGAFVGIFQALTK